MSPCSFLTLLHPFLFSIFILYPFDQRHLKPPFSPIVELSFKSVTMSSYPSFIQLIPDPLRRLRVQKLWLLAQYMAAAEKNVSEQIRSIDEQIARHGERRRLIEEFWKIENREEKDLGGFLDTLPDAASDNRFKHIASPQIAQGAAMHDKNREKETKRLKHEKVSLPLAATPTPSKIPAAHKITFDQQQSLQTPLKTGKIATKTAARAARGLSREREVASSSQHLKSSLAATAGMYVAESRIGRLNFGKQPCQDEK